MSPVAIRATRLYPLALAALGAACTRTPAPPARPEATREQRTQGPVPGTPAVATLAATSSTPVRPRALATPGAGRAVPAAVAVTDDACDVPARARAGRGWSLVGFRPGPALREVVALDRRRLAATTTSRVCTSDDGGETWTERFAAPGAGVTVALDPVDTGNNGWLLVARRGQRGAAAEDAEIAGVYVSRDGAAEHWEPLALARTASQPRAVFGDGLGRIFVATATQLYDTADFGAAWSPPRVLPGLEASELDACGAMLIARARVDADWFYHRSFDRGATWRPFRLGPIGVEGNHAVVRCLANDGVEAGRPPLPSHWSWDGGRTWVPAGYDQPARVAARALADEAASPQAPRCVTAPQGIACVDAGRARLLRAGSANALEIHAPATCSDVRVTDTRHTFAFGPTCGLYFSPDRGGVWRMVSQSFVARPAGTYAEGRGGFVDARTAWRLDGGIWWTFDGGAHWQPFASIGGRALERGVFVDRQRGVFATNTGWVVATGDGGRTWTYVLRGEVERIASARRAVIVTTTEHVRVSPDGGATWLAANALAPQQALDPTVEVTGTRRSVTVGSGVRVLQDGDRVAIERPGGAAADEIVQGLPAGYNLLAAHVADDAVDRVLLEGGVVVSRGEVSAPARAHPRHHAQRTHRRRYHRHRG